MNVKEVCAKTILSKSKVFDYTINPFIGCEHGCTYCYARFMKRFTGHKEAWGKFVDVKINASSLLEREVRKKPIGKVWISGMCDPYQPLEKKYELTKKCLEILLRHGWPVVIQTKSPLVLRDMELLENLEEVEVGLTITTAEDRIRQVFEPNAPSIEERLNACEKLHLAGVKTYAMIAPVLPEVEGLVSELSGKVDHVLVDKLNYHYADWVYRKYKVEHAMSDGFFIQEKTALANAFEREGIPYQLLF